MSDGSNDRSVVYLLHVVQREKNLSTNARRKLSVCRALWIWQGQCLKDHEGRMPGRSRIEKPA